MKIKKLQETAVYLFSSLLFICLLLWLFTLLGGNLSLDFHLLSRFFVPAFILSGLLLAPGIWRRRRTYLEVINLWSKKVSNYISTSYEKPFFRLLIFPLAFLFLAVIIIVGGIINSRQFNTVINRNYSKVNFVGPGGEILAGERVDAVLEVKENNLGIVAVRFNTFGRVNDDEVTFRIREIGAGRWYYEHDYKTDQFQPDGLFTFGFPVIKDSAGKSYEIEIESVSGWEGKAVAISQKTPQVQVRYKFSRSQLKNPVLATHFFLAKAPELLSDITFLGLIVFALCPFLIYLSWLYEGRELIAPLKSLEDYFSLALLVYLVLELITQITRILNTYWEEKFLAGDYLDLPKKILLLIIVTLGTLVVFEGRLMVSKTDSKS